MIPSAALHLSDSSGDRPCAREQFGNSTVFAVEENPAPQL
jgi:hypothetical protein